MAEISSSIDPKSRVGFWFKSIVIKKQVFLVTMLLFFSWILGNFVQAHPMPNSVILLNVHEKHISGQIQIPLSELQSAVGMSVNDRSERLIERLGDSLKIYLLKHIRPKSLEGKPWTVKLGNIKVVESNNILVGMYKELEIEFEMSPPLSYDLRNFYFDYDVVLRQVASHKALINIKQDWQQGIINEDSTAQQVGIIEWDVVNNKLSPFQVSLQQGSLWQGFKAMVKLGMRHISEGIDHLLFLLTLLLPATLLVENSRWGVFGGSKYSLIKLLKIVSAFTVGHSLTLILGATKLVTLPSQPVEVLIAFSILVSAIHAIRPVFAGKEIWIAAGFGLIHGLVFATTLTDLELGFREMILSIFGFNIGIELMQLLITVLTIPFLILLSKTRFYTAFRVVGATAATVAASGWIAERLTGQANIITTFLQ